jgi:hypothetical protein
MPIREVDTQVYEFPLSKRGVNLYSNIMEIHPEECFESRNLIYRNGMIKRGGQSKYTTNEVMAGKRIMGLHRFYYGSASAQLLVASDTKVKYAVPGSPITWSDVKTGLTSDKQTFFTTWLSNCYIANGVDAPHKWTGSASSAITGSPPTTTKMFLPYQDRLLSISGGDLSWSAAFSDTGTWETVAACGVRPDTQLFGMMHHSVTGQSAGYESKVLLAGANGMYIFSGTDLRPITYGTPPTGNYTIYPLSVAAGCNSPRTMCWTPKGTIWLGMDRQVYILPFGASTPIPIGHKIHSTGSIEGIEKIPSSELPNACAAYHDGFYILSVAQSGKTSNNVQWWLDIARLFQDNDGLYGPWYGPMYGQYISCFATQNGYGDLGELMAGESRSATGNSLVYQVNNNSIYADDGNAIETIWRTFYHPLGNTFLDKNISKMETEILNTNGTVNIDFYDINGNIKAGDSLILGQNQFYWGQAYWGVNKWSDTTPIRCTININPMLQTRRLSVLMKYNSSNNFQIYSLRSKAQEERSIFP